jgi:hypothetical protein
MSVANLAAAPALPATCEGCVVEVLVERKLVAAVTLLDSVLS